MIEPLHLVVGISEIVSLVLIVRLWKVEEYLLFKILIAGITLIPFVGPLFYFFVTGRAPVQPEIQQNRSRGYTGQYKTNWETRKPYEQEAVNKLKEKIEKNDKHSKKT